MNTATKLSPEALCDLIYASGREPTAYSGRNMYGKHCVAVFVVRGDACEDLPQEGLHWDTLGLGRVAYWPSVSAPKELA